MSKELNGYTLTKEWFDYAKNNLDKVECKHTATYLYIVELFNQNNWVKVIGLPSDFTMMALNIKSYKTYIKIINDLEKFDKIKFIERSKNIFTSNKIALVKNTKASAEVNPLRSESYTKASAEASEMQGQSDCSIIKLNKLLNNKLINDKTYKLIVEDSELVNSKLEDWITKEKKLKHQIPEKEFSEEIYNCFNSCLKYFEEHLHPKNKKIESNWLDTIDKLNRIDNIPFEKIIEITKKARSDDWWKKNFLSLPKLRTKNKDKILYIVYFNEKFKNNTSNESIQEIAHRAYHSQAAKDFSYD